MEIQDCCLLLSSELQVSWERSESSNTAHFITRAKQGFGRKFKKPVGRKPIWNVSALRRPEQDVRNHVGSKKYWHYDVDVSSLEPTTPPPQPLRKKRIMHP